MSRFVLLTLFFISAIGINVTAQKTVTFDDETKLVLNGKLITTFAKPDSFTPNKIEENQKSFYKMDGDTIEIAIFYEDLEKSFPKVDVFRFHPNELDLNELFIHEALDATSKFLYNYVSFNANANKEIRYVSYDNHFPKGAPSSFSYFTVGSMNKAELESLIKQVKLAAQTTVTFKDKSTYALDGRPIGERQLYSYEDPTKVERIEKSFYKIDGDTIEIAVYTAFTDKKIDELWIYRFHNNQLNTQELAVSDETQDDGQFLFYTIDFAAVESKFNSKKYTFENSKGEPMLLEFFNINADKQEGLEALIQIISIN